MRLVAALCGCVALAGCASEQAVRCPQLKAYSQLEQSAEADELAKLRSNYPETVRMIEDYSALRQACRAGG